MARQQYRTAAEQEAARQESALLRLQLRQMAEDVRGALAHEPTRRLLWVFLQTMGLDDSPFNTNAMAQSRARGTAALIRSCTETSLIMCLIDPREWCDV